MPRHFTYQCPEDIWGEAPTQAIYIKNCLVADVVDVITCAKFQNEIYFHVLRFYKGRSFHFPIDFWTGLTTVQRYCAACDGSVRWRHLVNSIEPSAHGLSGWAVRKRPNWSRCRLDRWLIQAQGTIY